MCEQLEQNAFLRNLAQHGAFNASATYQLSLQKVNASAQNYSYWTPTTLQIPFLLTYTHDKNKSRVATKWETKARRLHTPKPRRAHWDGRGTSAEEPPSPALALHSWRIT